jgi:3-oxoacyl-[acyl-carrier protein] reductase
MNIAGKIAVVTGASSGLGAALSSTLADKGALVYGLDRNAEKLQIIANNLGQKFVPVVIDISDQKAISSWGPEYFFKVLHTRYSHQ